MQLEVGSIEHLVTRLVFSFAKAVVPVDKSPYIITTFPWGFLFLLHLWRHSVGELLFASRLCRNRSDRQSPGKHDSDFYLNSVLVALKVSEKMVNTIKLIGTRAALF